MEKKEILNIDKQEYSYKSKISLQLSSYDSIFSDFDPRPTSERALSDDFLSEAKKASIDKEENIELSFLIPRSQRRSSEEAIIKKRLKEHFKKHFKIITLEKQKIRKEGFFLCIIGIILMLIATFVIYSGKKTLLYSFLIVLLEPSGWFSFWEGLHSIVFKPREKNPELNFYKKMSLSLISFESY